MVTDLLLFCLLVNWLVFNFRWNLRQIEVTNRLPCTQKTNVPFSLVKEIFNIVHQSDWIVSLKSPTVGYVANRETLPIPFEKGSSSEKDSRVVFNQRKTHFHSISFNAEKLKWLRGLRESGVKKIYELTNKQVNKQLNK